MSETDGLSQRFADAMRRLEGDGDIEPLVALYAEDCVAGNVLRPDQFQGLDGRVRSGRRTGPSSAM